MRWGVAMNASMRGRRASGRNPKTVFFKPPKEARCAIYTRVSTDHGLEQEFNSLDAQREACEAYVKSQLHEGWSLIDDRFDDGGFSGGGLDRPALHRLLAQIEARKIDTVVVYKVDRLTRSLADFAKLIELFEAHDVSFVSITQSFNTTTSMGRLTLNVLLSFAQFEREVAGERIRDKVAASKKKGIWVGGVVPFGYRLESRKLLIDDAEAETVRWIFRRYLEVDGMTPLLAELRSNGVTTRQRVLATGKVIGGIPFGRGALGHLLKNLTYVGELNHRGTSYATEHLPIVERDIFEAVQTKLAENLTVDQSRRTTSDTILIGRIYDDRGNRMTPTHSRKNGARYRYYTSRALSEGRKDEAGSLTRVPAPEIEALVVEAIRTSHVGWSAQSSGELENAGSVSATAAAQDILEPTPDDRALVAAAVDRVVIGAGSVDIHLERT